MQLISVIIPTLNESKNISKLLEEIFQELKSHKINIMLDSELQHPPHKIQGLVNSVNNGADTAIASRYTEQGSLGNISTIRKIVAFISSFSIDRLFPQIRDISDKGSGFFAFKKNIIQNVSLNPLGYKILLEILILGRYNKIAEIGYTFEKRHSGKSKLNIFIIFDQFHQLIRLFYLSKKRFP